MKRLLLIMLLAVFILPACRKSSSSTAVDSSKWEYFIFARTGGFCGGACHHYYKLMNGAIYEGYTDSAYGVSYHTTPMAADKYQVGAALKAAFPTYLESRPNTNYGCMGCADQQYIYLEYKKNGVVYTWTIDIYQDQQAEVKPYMTQVNTAIDQLQP